MYLKMGSGALRGKRRTGRAAGRAVAWKVMSAPDTWTEFPAWIDLVDPSPDDVARVAREFSLAVPSRESLLEIELSSRLRSDANALYLSLPLAGPEGQAHPRPDPLGFILSPRVLVTIRYAEIATLEQVKARCRAEHPADGPAVFATLIETFVDHAADRLEALTASLGAMSARVFRSPQGGPLQDRRLTQVLREALRSVGTVGDDLSLLRETLLGLQRIVRFGAERAIGGLSPDVATRLRTADHDLASLVDFETHLSSKAQFLLDAILGFISTEQNDVFKLLTIVSVAGIPPTLIASLYGMNFRFMPELEWRFGYPFAIALVILSTLGPLLWFKRRGWW